MAITNEAHIRVKIDGKDAEISVKDMGKAIETAMKRGKVEADKLKTSFTKIGDAAQRFYFSLQSMKIIWDRVKGFSQLALKAEDVRSAFNKITPPNFLKELRENVKDTVDDFTLMQNSVQAIDLGATTEQLKVFAEFARLEALRKGGDTAVRFQEIISGVLRGSTELLDNFGINLTDLNRKIQELAGGKALSAVERRSLSVEAAVQIMNERLKEAGDVAVSDAEKAQQMTVSWKNMQITGGQLINLFLEPLYALLKPIVDFITEMDQKTKMMIGTLGLIGIALWKLIPLLKTLGIVSKSALGWIGIIITVLGLLYTAWTTNFLGIRDALTNFWEFLKGWASNIGSTLKALGKLIVGVLTFDISKIKQGWKELTDSFVSHWKKAFQETKTETEKAVKVLGWSLKEPVQEIGEKLGGKFGESFVKGFKSIIAVGEPRGGAKPSIIEEMEELTEPGRSPFWDFIDMWDEMKNMGMATMDFLANSIQMLSNTMVQAMFNTKTKFKDLWQAMAMDFTRIFVNYVLGQLAKFLAIKVIANILPNIVAPGAGTIISAATFTPGFTAAGAGGNQLTSIDNRLSNLESKLTGPIVINRIGSRQLYEAVSQGREIDLIRRGKDINKSFF